MGLFTKIFNRAPASQSRSTPYHESETTTDHGSKNAPRRELVHVVLRDMLRLHGIPSDWIDCEILSVTSAGVLTGMHVHLIVRRGHDRLLTYVPAFQSSFLSAISAIDARASDWLMSLSWQFRGMGDSAAQQMPDPRVWAASGAAALPVAQVEKDAQDESQDVEQDLQALFAIRDAAMKDDPAPLSGGHKDFEPTRPGL